MILADRLQNLGSETAFVVSAAAAAHAAEGHAVYPFHVGDINLPTAPNIVAAATQAMHDGKTGYVPPAGIPALRDALAQDVSQARGVRYSAEQVSVQPGGKPVIGKFLQAVMNPGDAVLYPTPGFPIYESQIDYLGGVATPYRYLETSRGFAIDLDYLAAQITPRTRALIYNNCQNPLGAESEWAEVERLAELAQQHDLLVLTDDAYSEVRYSGTTAYIVSLPGMAERTVTLYTFSKKYAMTGWRLGAAIGPTPIIDAISRMNVNDESCTAQPTQWAGVEALTGDQRGALENIAILRERRDAAVALLNAIDGVSVHTPETAFYLFPNVTGAMRRCGFDDVNAFATAALHETGVSFCTHKHFGRALPGVDASYARFAYSGIDVGAIREGLGRLQAWLG